MSVIAHCFSHGKKIIQGSASRAIREMFFEYSDKKGILAKIFDDILCKAESEDLFRKDDCVFKRTDNNRFEFISSYDNFLIDCLDDHPDIIEMPRRFHDLMVLMYKMNNKRFPFVTQNKRYIGFSNGILDIISGELVEIGKDIIPRHYIDQPFQVDDLNTPLFDKIVRYQLENDDVYNYMFAFIGRLFYNVGQFDNFDIIPFIVGSTGTGKSTIMHIISSMFAPNSVGSINSTHEIIFGLQRQRAYHSS